MFSEFAIAPSVQIGRANRGFQNLDSLKFRPRSSLAALTQHDDFIYVVERSSDVNFQRMIVIRLKENVPKILSFVKIYCEEYRANMVFILNIINTINVSTLNTT